MATNDEVLEDTLKIGPAESSRIYRLTFSRLVEAVTGFSDHGRRRSIISEMKSVEDKYLDTGLAVKPFPTYYQRIVIAKRKAFLEYEKRVHQEMEKYGQRGNLSANPEEIKLCKAVVDSTQSILKMMKEQKNAGIDKVLGGDEPSDYCSSITDAPLMLQYEHDGEIEEIYSIGYRDNGKIQTPHQYFIFTFDGKTGNLNSKKELPFPLPGSNFLYGIPTFFANLLTLGVPSLIMLGLSVPFKRNLEKRMLEISQEQWEKRRSR